MSRVSSDSTPRGPGLQVSACELGSRCPQLALANAGASAGRRKQATAVERRGVISFPEPLTRDVEVPNSDELSSSGQLVAGVRTGSACVGRGAGQLSSAAKSSTEAIICICRLRALFKPFSILKMQIGVAKLL